MPRVNFNVKIRAFWKSYVILKDADRYDENVANYMERFHNNLLH